MNDIESNIPDDDIDDETAIFQRRQPDLEDELDDSPQLTCPVCQRQQFERVDLYGRRAVGKMTMFWRSYQASWVDKKLARYKRVKKLDAYRCRRCNYLMLFAR